MPAGVDVTEPGPVTATATVRRAGANVAVAVASAESVSTQVGAAPAQAPPQLPNAALASAAAVSVTCVPRGTVSVHAAPQAIPAGVEVTAPGPVRAMVSTTSVAGGASGGASMGASASGASMSGASASGASVIGASTWPHAAQSTRDDSETRTARMETPARGLRGRARRRRM